MKRTLVQPCTITKYYQDHVVNFYLLKSGLYRAEECRYDGSDKLVVLDIYYISADTLQYLYGSLSKPFYRTIFN
jgi:hypothetical protein